MRRLKCSGLIKRAVSLSMAAAMTMSLTGCGGSEKPSEKTYTYNTSMAASPKCWNPHTWSDSADKVLSQYCEMGLVSVIATDDGGFQWAFEMAENITDITAEFADKAKYAIEDGQTGRVWQIKLNEDACWEDGTKINADTYIESMKLLLDSQMKNYRANSYYDPVQSDIAIYNAEDYYNNDKVGKTKYSPMSELGYETVEDALAAGVKAEDIMLDMKGFYKIDPETDSGYIQYQDTTKYRDEDVKEGSAGDYVTAKEIYDAFFAPGAKYESYAASYIYVPNGVHEETKFEDVGIYKVDDYTINYITVNPISEFYFFTGMTSNWLVKEDVYNSGKSEENGLVATTYGTSVDTYSSYGPYKLVSFEKDKQFVMEKNENWYGYKDDEHKDQYQTTKVVVNIISDHATELQLFLSGDLDDVILDVDDMSKYRMSDRLYSIDQTYTLRWIFATDLDALKAIELEVNDGTNKRVLSYDDFRKAMSLAMDRERFCSEATPGYTPAYYLINSIYYTDIENDSDSQYRNTDEAKQAVLNLYDIKYGDGEKYATLDDAYKAVTGYDIEEAKRLFQSVYEQAIADGNYTEGQTVKIRCMASAASSLTAQDIAQQDLLNEMLAAATVGTGFEGKIVVEFMCGAENRYLDCANGKIEMIKGAWGGAAFYPFKLIGCYTDPNYTGGYIHEQCGWNPTTDKLAITYDFDGDGTAETVEKTYQQWTKDINDNAVYGENAKVRLTVLSALETGILSQYQCIPWATETESSLLSQKVEYGVKQYNIMYDFGGIRYLKYNYDDAAWEKYVKEQGGTLDYE